MKASLSFDKYRIVHLTTQRHIPKNLNPQTNPFTKGLTVLNLVIRFVRTTLKKFPKFLLRDKNAFIFLNSF
jgi:hypothetical protein